MGSPPKGGQVIKRRTDLKEVELTGAHPCHSLADGGLDSGARNVTVFEHTPFGAAQDGAGWELLLKLPLLE
jgi:hypothetical protein